MRLIFKQYNKEKDVNDNVNWLMKEEYWEYISCFQPLSEKFIEKYADCVSWYWVSYYQKLSEEFIENYEYKVDWYWILRSQKLSSKFRQKWKHKCG
jgi:hypothetical protein